MLRKTEERTFFAHHMLLHVAELEIQSAEASRLGEFNRCLTAMVMSALAVEALVNAVGYRVAEDWPAFESLKAHQKLDWLANRLALSRQEEKEPWSTLRYLGGFRDDIAHPKPEQVVTERFLPQAEIDRSAFDIPKSRLEKEITLGNARRCFSAVNSLKMLFTDALPADARLGIYADMWHGGITAK
jgi:hypothetical protein